MDNLPIENDASLSDADLVEGIRQNRDGAWESFYARFSPMIGSVVSWSKWHFGHHEKEDVMQNIHVELQIAIRQCIAEIRRQVRSRQMLVPLARPSAEGGWQDLDVANDKDVDPCREIARNEEISEVARVMTLLSETCVTAIQYCYVQRMSYKEIAGRLGIAVNTVGSRLSKCLVRLRELLMANRQPVNHS